MNLFTKQKQIHRCRRHTYGYRRGKVQKEIFFKKRKKNCLSVHVTKKKNPLELKTNFKKTDSGKGGRKRNMQTPFGDTTSSI